MNSLRKVLILGATSTIAEHAARSLLAQGASLYCVGRDKDRLGSIIEDLQVRGSGSARVAGESADLLDSSNHEALIDRAEKSMGGMDGVLIAHGTLPDQKECEKSVEMTLAELDVNGVSVIRLLTLLANRFELAGSGVIAVISSVAGDRGRQSNYVYGAAKGMVSIFLQGLRNRLHGKGVAVVTIKPGFVDTPMTDGLDKSGPLWATPNAVGNGIVAAMRSGKPVAYLPRFWWAIMFIIRHIPEFVFKRLSL